MSKERKEMLIREAGMQNMALMRIALWRNFSVLLSALGIVIAWYGFSIKPNRLIAFFGVLIAIVFLLASAVCHIGIQNGTANVNKILDAAEKE